jgi:hypothetical protein
MPNHGDELGAWLGAKNWPPPIHTNPIKSQASKQALAGYGRFSSQTSPKGTPMRNPNAYSNGFVIGAVIGLVLLWLGRSRHRPYTGPVPPVIPKPTPEPRQLPGPTPACLWN